MIKVAVCPKDSFFASYLERIGVPLTSPESKDAKIIHFFVLKGSRVRKLLKKKASTLFVFHVQPDIRIAKRNLIAYVPALTKRKDLGKKIICYSNCPKLTKTYFDKIGIQIISKEFVVGIPKEQGRLLSRSLAARMWALSKYLKALISKYKEKLLLE